MANLLRRVFSAVGKFFRNQRGDYVDARGQVVDRAQVLGVFDRRVADAKSLFATLNAERAAGRIGLEAWRDAMAMELRRTHLQLYALGKGGWSAVNRDEWNILSGRIREELTYLRKFASDISAGRLSEAQITARANLYANHLQASFYDGLTAGKQRAGLTEERRFLGKAEHCDDCIGYAGQGWVPIGTLPSPGDGSVCQSNCQCTIEYR